MTAFINANWAGSTDDKKSTSRAAHFLGDFLVSWANKKQSSISLSTSEAEYIVAAACCTHILQMKQILEDMRVEFEEPLPIMVDKTSEISISKNLALHSKTKHIPIKYHSLREQVVSKFVKLEYIASSEQVEDIFTKPLPRDKFEYLREKMGIVHFQRH